MTKKKEKKGISIREYSRRKGVSDTAVHKAFEEGKIVNGIVYPEDGSRPYVLEEIADEEWGKHLNPARGNNSHLVETLEEKKTEKTPSKGIDTALTSQEIQSTPDIKENETFNEALRKERIYKAKILKLQFHEKEGELVNKGDINKQLFELGKQVRIVFEALPNTTIDNILSANTRSEALLIFKKSINDALQKMVTSLK
jgi:hypothetical protein